MSILKLGLIIETTGSEITSRTELVEFLRGSRKIPKIQKFGASDLASELTKFEDFKDPAFITWASASDADISIIRFKALILSGFGIQGMPRNLLWRPTAHGFDKKCDMINALWPAVIPDGRGFSSCYTGYAAIGSHERDQSDSEYANRLNCVISYPAYHAVTEEYLYHTEALLYPLDHLDLLPGLMWRIAMGEHHFEKYNISPEEISKVCVATEETTAANGDKLWKFQSREDPLDWRDSYERQLKLNRPDVFFDIAPLRERFCEPADIKDSGRGKELEKLFKTALIELYPEAATKGIVV
jgi:hypothetical protein